MKRRNFLSLAAASAPALVAASAVKGQLKITGLETDLLRFPPGRPFSDAIHNFGHDGGGVALRLITDAGITGWAYTSFGMIAGGPKVVQTILETEVKPVLIGQDPAFPKRLRADLWKAVEYHGVGGVATFALAAADIALWDILGKAYGQPVYKMLGAFGDRMPAYAMCGWYYENDDDLSQFRKAISSFKPKLGGRFENEASSEQRKQAFPRRTRGAEGSRSTPMIIDRSEYFGGTNTARERLTSGR